jgi:hypothetical protein
MALKIHILPYQKNTTKNVSHKTCNNETYNTKFCQHDYVYAWVIKLKTCHLVAMLIFTFTNTFYDKIYDVLFNSTLIHQYISFMVTEIVFRTSF